MNFAYLHDFADSPLQVVAHADVCDIMAAEDDRFGGELDEERGRGVAINRGQVNVLIADAAQAYAFVAFQLFNAQQVHRPDAVGEAHGVGVAQGFAGCALVDDAALVEHDHPI